MQLTLKNSAEVAEINDHVFIELSKDSRLASLQLFENLRLHSSGCVVFQKSKKRKDGEGYQTETIYLHKLIAERYLEHTRTKNSKLVGCRNGNKRDCRLDNLEYRSRAVASRKRKTSSKVGYTGVYKENNRFRAVISQNRRSIHIGMYATAEEAAMAYNAKSLELYGSAGKLNIIKPHTSHDDSLTKEDIRAKSIPSAKTDRPSARKKSVP